MLTGDFPFTAQSLLRRRALLLKFLYRRFRLPKDHSYAHDENGRRQVTKYSAIWDVELARFNPEER